MQVLDFLKKIKSERFFICPLYVQRQTATAPAPLTLVNGEALTRSLDNLLAGSFLAPSVDNPLGRLAIRELLNRLQKDPDYDGLEATPFVPMEMLSTEWVLPMEAEYVAFLAVRPDVADGAVELKVYSPNGLLREESSSLSSSLSSSSSSTNKQYSSTVDTSIMRPPSSTSTIREQCIEKIRTVVAKLLS